MEKSPQAAFNGDAPCALSIADISGTTNKNRDKLHGCAEHKGEGIGKAHLDESIGERIGRSGLEEKEENRSNGEQPEAGYDAGDEIKSQPGDEEEGEDGKAQAF